MKKIFFALIFIFASFGAKAQYAEIEAMLQRLEEKRGINQNLKDVSIDDKKFVLIKNFDDHTERSFIVIKGNQATYVEIFDDKKSGESSTNVFSGDVVRTANNVISIRCDKLEGKKIAMPITKTLKMAMQKKIVYLIDINTKERWIDETYFNKK